MKYLLGLLLAASFNANACYVVGGYVQCAPTPPVVIMAPPPVPVYIPPAPFVPAPLPSTGVLIK